MVLSFATLVKLNLTPIHACVFSCPRVIHCTWVYPVELYPPFFGYYFFNAMLLLLQMLHLYWAALIAHMFYKLLTNSVCLFCVCFYVKVFPCVTFFLTELLSQPISFSFLQFNGDDRSDQEEEDSTDTSEKDNHKGHTNDPGARSTRH